MPELVESDGKQAVTRILSSEEYLTKLGRKITEESAEFQADKSISMPGKQNAEEFCGRISKAE